MIDPTKEDIGKSVFYIRPGRLPELCYIRSFNHHVVFVHPWSSMGSTLQGCRREDLYWPEVYEKFKMVRSILTGKAEEKKPMAEEDMRLWKRKYSPRTSGKIS